MTIILIALNVLMFLLESLAGGSEDIRVALRFGAYYAPYVLGDGEWYRLFTSVFLHFGPEHLGSNMLSLYVLGSFVEQYFGRLRYLVIYLISGLCGNLLVMGIDMARWNAAGLRRIIEPVLAFERRFGAHIFVGEFSAIAYAEGCGQWIADVVEMLNECRWDWCYHAFREWPGWSVEHVVTKGDSASNAKFAPSADNARKRALVAGLRGVKP